MLHRWGLEVSSRFIQSKCFTLLLSQAGPVPLPPSQHSIKGVPLPAPHLKGGGGVMEVAHGAPPLPTEGMHRLNPTLPPCPEPHF